MAQLFNRTTPALVKKAKKLGIRRPKRANGWTVEQHEYMAKNIRKKSYKEISEYLGIPGTRVFNHANQLNAVR